MKPQFNDLVLIETAYRPDVGSFAKSKSSCEGRHKVDHWFYCREIFHHVLFRLKLLFFAHEANKGVNIAAFLTEIENRLNVQPRSEFGPTQRKTIMWVRPSKWWLQYSMRRSLFTILLRAGCNYNFSKNNFEEAVGAEKYLKKTIYAFDRFMRGYTKYVGHKRGWYKQFYHLSPTADEIDKLLQKPSH